MGPQPVSALQTICRARDTMLRCPHFSFNGPGAMSIQSVLPALLRLWCCTLLCATASANAADQPVLRWCMDHFPGFHEFHHNSRLPVGPSVEMMQELASRAGFSLQMSGKTPASRCLKQLADGEADLMTNLLYSPKRVDSLVFIRFASRHPDRLYLAAADPRRITALPQLSSLSIVTVRGFGLHPTLQQVVDALPAKQKQQVQSTDTALQMVAKGRVDATLLPPTQVSQIYRQQPELASQLREVAFTSDNVVPQDVYLGLSRHITDPAIEASIRSSLQQMKQDGTLARIFGNKILD